MEKMAFGINSICRLYLDGEVFHECFNREVVESMKSRLVQAGISAERLRVTERMPNI